jgi:hypothetical protein
LRDRGHACLAAGDFAQAGAIAEHLVALDLRQGLHLQGQILTGEYPQDDHTDFWSDAAAKCPDDPDFLRKKIHAALKADRLADAESGMALLIETHPTRARDSGFIIGLANIYHRKGDRAALRRIVRKFLKSLRGTTAYRVAALRLSRIIFSHFPHTGRIARAYNERFGRMLVRAPINATPKALLTRAVELEHALAAKAQIALFDTDVSPRQCGGFISLVRDRLKTGTPFSFVRLGDGESNCLDYEPHLSAFKLSDAVERERIWWGDPLDTGTRAKLSARVSQAIWEADCIGIPTVSRLLRDLKLEENDALESSRPGRGLRAVLGALEHMERLRPRDLAPPIFTSSHLHQDIARWDLYDSLFDGVHELVLVSCHPDLADIVRKRFNVTIAGNILIPPRYASIGQMRHRIADPRSLPQMLDEVTEKLGALPQNRMVLIGAGYLGKWLTGLAKARGGVALDLGSIVDYWIGLATRSYIDLGSA